MPRIVFIGDELTATGLRLVGAEVVTPEVGEESLAFERVSGASRIILIGSDVAAKLPAAQLEQALLSLDPVVAVVPDVRGTAPLPDQARRLRRILGIET